MDQEKDNSDINSHNSALSSYIYGMDYVKGDILVRSIRVTNSTPATFYCTFDFNAGQEMSGYSGIQDSPDKGKIFIFSLWNSFISQDNIKASYLGDGTVVNTFDGEGEGTKSVNSKLGWKLNIWYTLVLRRWDGNNITHVGFWVHDPDKGWIHLVTLDYPVKKVFFSSETGSFLEDWETTGHNLRRLEMRDSFKRNAQYSYWIPIDLVYFSTNEEDKQKRSSNYKDAYDAGVIDRGYYIQIGGSTINSCKFIGSSCALKTLMPTKPQFEKIDFSIISLTCNNVKWKVYTRLTSQFRYIIKIDGIQIYDAIETEKSEVTFDNSIIKGTELEITLEDILGEKSSRSITFI